MWVNMGLLHSRKRIFTSIFGGWEIQDRMRHKAPRKTNSAMTATIAITLSTSLGLRGSFFILYS